MVEKILLKAFQLVFTHIFLNPKLICCIFFEVLWKSFQYFLNCGSVVDMATHDIGRIK